MGKDYQLIGNFNYQTFEDNVKKFINAGWVLVGGICVVYGQFNDQSLPDPNGKLRVMYYQAVAKL